MKYHEGELAIQGKLGVQHNAARIARSIRSEIPGYARVFAEGQTLAVVGSVDEDGRVWASPLTGDVGFLHATNDYTFELDVTSNDHDPLYKNINHNPQLGMIVIDLATRSRIRVNGQAEVQVGGIKLNTSEVYGNCPQHITPRYPQKVERDAVTTSTGDTLNAVQQDWIARADTFFIASYHEESGADASHRGGPAGFVHVLDDNTIEFPDYSGNMMFNTLGNIASHPQSGLLFIDFASGHTLQLTGTATIHWDQERIAQFPNAQRTVEFHIHKLIQTNNIIPYKFADMYSK